MPYTTRAGIASLFLGLSALGSTACAQTGDGSPNPLDNLPEGFQGLPENAEIIYVACPDPDINPEHLVPPVLKYDPQDPPDYLYDERFGEDQKISVLFEQSQDGGEPGHNALTGQNGNAQAGNDQRQGVKVIVIEDCGLEV